MPATGSARARVHAEGLLCANLGELQVKEPITKEPGTGSWSGALRRRDANVHRSSQERVRFSAYPAAMPEVSEWTSRAKPREVGHHAAADSPRPQSWERCTLPRRSHHRRATGGAGDCSTASGLD